MKFTITGNSLGRLRKVATKFSFHEALKILIITQTIIFSLKIAPRKFHSTLKSVGHGIINKPHLNDHSKALKEFHLDKTYIADCNPIS